MSDLFHVNIDSLDHEARGVGRLDGKVIFVDGALPGERVQAQLLRKKPSYSTARAVHIERESSLRVKPQCQYFGVCGGCLMQHVAPDAQVAIKQRILEDAFTHLAGVKPAQMLSPIHGPTWGYRFRARLTVRLVPRKGGILVGFHERRSRYVADMTSCEVLPRHLSDLLVPLRHLIQGLSIADRLPQIEVAVGSHTTALVLRHLEPLSDSDCADLSAFARKHGVQWWLQPKGPDSIHLLEKDSTNLLAYDIPEFGIRMPFKPTDFTQVNHAINQVLVSKAIALLDPKPDDRVVDLFCGLGNFTLPLARVSREVLGIEGSQALVDRAQAAALGNAIANCQFEARNLFEMTVDQFRALGRIDRLLIDPPREGALAVCEALAALAADERPKRLVYVSCNPATLARDTAIVCHHGGWRLMKAGVVNMFPHTGHVESIAVFESVGLV
jgi:23S rRNA (uracil1939-C5)-methyltransferase